MALSSGDYCTSFSIKSSRLLDEVTFLALIQSRLTCLDLTCLPCVITLTIFFFFFLFLVNLFNVCSSLHTQVVLILRPVCGFLQLVRIFVYIYGLCVLGNLCVQNTSFVRKSTFEYVQNLCTRSNLCIRVRLFV